MGTASTRVEAARTAQTVWRMESPRIIGGLLRMTRDLGLAEEYAQDALVAALEAWPKTGVPANPGSWLMLTARRRAVDAFRRAQLLQVKLREVAHDVEAEQAADAADDIVDGLDDYTGDDVLRLIITACHPALSVEARVALTLRFVAGLTTAEIARAYLLPEPTVAQRLVRAKRRLLDEPLALTLPPASEVRTRVGPVLEVIFSIFNEGYSASGGPDWTRPQLCADALRLGRRVVALIPDEPEVHGLVALMELQASRLRARSDEHGRPVLLAAQDRLLWDQLLIRRGLAALETATGLGRPVGPYTVQAAIAACHARTAVHEDTDWGAIADLYQVLAEIWPSPVVHLNWAVAVAEEGRLVEAMEMTDQLVSSGRLATYPHLAAVRGDLLTRLGRHGEAREAFSRAARLTRNEQERKLFDGRAAGVQVRD